MDFQPSRCKMERAPEQPSGFTVELGAQVMKQLIPTHRMGFQPGSQPLQADSVMLYRDFL